MLTRTSLNVFISFEKTISTFEDPQDHEASLVDVSAEKSQRFHSCNPYQFGRYSMTFEAEHRHTSSMSLMPIPDLAEAWIASVQSSPIVASTCEDKSFAPERHGKHT